MQSNLSREASPEAKRMRINSKHVAEGAATFQEVCAADVFVDKSLLIKEFWNSANKSLLISFPRRWGKSINLDMIKEFFSLKLNDQGQVDQATDKKSKDMFKALKISNNPEIMEKMGKYPVIYVDMKSIKCTKSSIAQEYLAEVVFGAFRQHKYLAISETLDEYQRKDVKQYIEGTNTNRPKITNGLMQLSEYLNKHHDTKVIVLVDEYDAGQNYAYRKSHDQNEAAEISEIFKLFYESTFKGNRFIERSLVTGIQRLAKDDVGSGMSNFDEHGITTDKFAKYYGFTQEEVNKLYEFMYSDDESLITKMADWYNGYQQGCNDSYVQVYCAWSIVKFLNTSRFEKYWAESGAMVLFDKIFSHPQIKHKIEELTKGKNIEFTLNKEITSAQFQKLKQMEENPHTIIDKSGEDLFFSYLLLTGYLTPSQVEYNSFKIPNHELELEFRDKLKSYYQNVYSLNIERVHKVTDALTMIMSSTDQQELKSLVKEQFYKNFKTLIDECRLTSELSDSNTGLFGNEDLVHSILNFISIQVLGIKFATEIYTHKIKADQSLGGKGRADIMLGSPEKGVIIEMKYTKGNKLNAEQLIANNKNTSKDALVQAKEYSNLITNLNDNTEDVMQIFLGLSVSSNRDVALAGEIHSSISSFDSVEFTD